LERAFHAPLSPQFVDPRTTCPEDMNVSDHSHPQQRFCPLKLKGIWRDLAREGNPEIVDAIFTEEKQEGQGANHAKETSTHSLHSRRTNQPTLIGWPKFENENSKIRSQSEVSIRLKVLKNNPTPISQMKKTRIREDKDTSSAWFLWFCLELCWVEKNCKKTNCAKLSR
jgi:hypothetical protein